MSFQADKAVDLHTVRGFLGMRVHGMVPCYCLSLSQGLPPPSPPSLFLPSPLPPSPNLFFGCYPLVGEWQAASLRWRPKEGALVGNSKEQCCEKLTCRHLRASGVRGSHVCLCGGVGTALSFWGGGWVTWMCVVGVGTAFFFFWGGGVTWMCLCLLCLCFLKRGRRVGGLARCWWV